MPGLPELALRSGRQVRWCGATGKYQYGLLHHAFLTESIVLRMLTGRSRALRDTMSLHALVHDLHEALTGDIPTWFKTPEQRSFQKALDARIYSEVLRVPMPGPKYRQILKIADERAMHAEAVVLRVQWALEGWEEISQQKSIRDDEADVEHILGLYGSSNLVNTPFSRGVTDYIAEVETGANEYRKRCGAGTAEGVEDDAEYHEPLPADFVGAYTEAPDLELLAA